FKLDPESTSSMLGVGGTYSTTDSLLGGIFLRTYWDQDRKRLTVFGGGGKINNDYEDFLGSGLPAQTTDTMKIVQARYLQQVKNEWFAGVKATYTNYLISSENSNVNDALDSLGLTGFDSVALGLVAMYDSRNNQNTPSAGIQFALENFAYRKALGGEEDFDTYTMKFNHYLPHGNSNVLAYRIQGRWTSDASPGGYSSVTLRGYTRGQYLAPHSTMIEFEERLHIKGRYGVNLFAGLASLYGDGESGLDADNLYPSIGLGGQIIINKAEQIAMTFDVALGESGNNGIYMRFGQAF
ncbi:MAG: BamA/TamA family outer membrane protein, partial [Desulfatitalea sp.]|nr:BamA/TamA family outer membrane protein [Desulfatitalea sp.]NNK02024.1 BamA/TamA family outer membrane protein [Desulfatitalea sp.]